LDLKNQAVAEYFACIDNAQTTDYLKNKAKKSLQLLNNNETVSN